MKKILSFLLACISLSAAAQIRVKIYDQCTVNNCDFWPLYVTPFNGKLLMFGDNYAKGRQLYSYDHTTENFKAVSYINPHKPPYAMTTRLISFYKNGEGLFGQPWPVLNNIMYFNACNDTNGTEIWKYDGVHAPEMTADLEPGAGGCEPMYLTTLNNKLYFHGYTTADLGGMYEYDPVKNSFRILNHGIAYDPVEITAFQNKLYYSDNVQSAGREVWQYDPAKDTTQALADLFVIKCVQPQQFMVFNNKLFFIAMGGSSRVPYEFDGAHAPKPVTVDNAPSFNAGIFFVYENELLFTLSAAANITDVYRYDAGSGKFVLKTANLGVSITRGIEYAHKFYFSGDDGTTGIEIWNYDGKTAKLAKDIYPGKPSSKPANFAVIDKALYFSADSDTKGIELVRLVDSDAYRPFASNINITTYNGRINVYPNPVKDVLHMDIAIERSAELNIAVVDMYGRKLYTENRSFGQNEHTIDIDVHTFPTGTYMYQITDNEGRKYFTGKLLKE